MRDLFGSQTGCGNADFSRDLYDAGFVNQVNNDYSEVVIDQMRKRNADVDMDWRVMDVRDMSELETGSFDCVLDKSIVDTLACSTGSIENIDKMLYEVWRVLKPGGVYIAICYGEPDTRLHYFEGRSEEGLDWMVEHVEFPQDPNANPFPNPNVDLSQDPVQISMLQMSVEPLDEDSPTSNYMYMCQKIPPGLILTLTRTLRRLHARVPNDSTSRAFLFDCDVITFDLTIYPSTGLSEQEEHELGTEFQKNMLATMKVYPQKPERVPC